MMDYNSASNIADALKAIGKGLTNIAIAIIVHSGRSETHLDKLK